MMLHDGQIRPAHADEAPMLTELQLRSKGYWGYTSEQMARYRAEMCVTAEQIANNHVYVLETAEGIPAGFCQLIQQSEGLWLEDLFIEPAFIGKGYGKHLFLFAADQARNLGYTEFGFESEAHAEDFYLKLGAVRIGERQSTVSGLTLPLMRYVLPPV